MGDLQMGLIPRGRLLASASSTASASGKSTLHTIEGLADITFTVRSLPVLVLLVGSWVNCTGGNVAVSAHIADDANAVKAYGPLALLGTTTLTTFRGVNCGMAHELITTPGDYTRRGRIERFEGTPTFGYGGQATIPWRLLAIEL